MTSDPIQAHGDNSMHRNLVAAEVRSLADLVEQAQLEAKPIQKLTNEHPGMTLGDGYAIQRALLERRCAQGQRQTGWKAGLTSRAKMEQMGVRLPTIGFLMEGMARPEGSAIRTDDLVHPRAECEVAFMTRATLSGPACTREEVIAATDFVMPAIEIIDSRFSGFKFDLPSVVADNSSSARYVLGGRVRPPAELDLAALEVVLEKNGEPQATAVTAAVMGHPADAVALVVKVLHALGDALPAGSLVLSGGITEAIPVQAGDHVCARFQELGAVAVRFA